jgi:hypothetical protein
VVVGPGTPMLTAEGEVHHFCCEGCMRTFEARRAAGA